MYDIAIIGAGVVGGMIARELSRYSLKTVILEASSDVATGATRANSAIVHAGFDAKAGSLKSKLNVRGALLMPKVCSELGVKYKNIGSLVVGFNDEDRATLYELKQRGTEAGVPDLAVLEREELLKIEKGIGDTVTCALFAPTGSIVCPYELCIATVGNAMDNGCELKTSFKVDKAERISGGYRVYAGEDFIEAKRVINCAGVYADEVARLFGDDSFSISPRRGEYLLLDRTAGNTVSHTIFRCPSKLGKGILVSPTVDGNLLLGPTALDLEDKESTETSAEGLGAVRAKALEQVKGIDLRAVITSFAGLRATGSTGDFIINEKDGYINVAGIESPGLSASPAIAEYVCDLLKASGVALTEITGYVPTRAPMHRFSELSTEEKNALIAERPEYGRIICRCEKVTEGEILDAIRTNPRPTDLDGVKRRTRATMGRCQGGFCSPFIVEMLAREMGCDYLDITKSGGSSYINLKRTKEV